MAISSNFLAAAVVGVAVMTFVGAAPTFQAPVELRTQWAPAVSWEASLAAGDEGGALIVDVAAGLGDLSNIVKERAPEFAKTLQPMYASTPKNEHDRLGHSAVRYTLNRFFVQRHGWFVNGIFTGEGGINWNNTSVTGLLVQHVPVRARHAFERRLSGWGLDLDGLALLASTIEAVILDGAVQELRQCYKLLHISTEGSIDSTQADKLIAALIALRVTDSTHSALSRQAQRGDLMDWLEPLAVEVYPRWPTALLFLRKVREEVAPPRGQFHFQDVADVAMKVESRWAGWSANIECRALKGKLLKIEEGHHTGCVRLSDFYARSMDPNDGWQFKEGPDYLRQLGALDESIPGNPRLIVPNYINAPGNCVAKGKFYQACCISECETLQLEIERQLQTPTPRPEDITEVVRSLGSASVPSGSVLSRSLVRRIHEIARVHGGRVPLQGRLMRQWLHFAYPSECPFPHLAGSTSPVAVDLYSDSQLVSEDYAWKLIHTGKGFGKSKANGTCTQWRDEEELYVPTLRPSWKTLSELEQDPSVWSSIHAVGALSAFALIVAGSLRGLRMPTERALSKAEYLV